jgi:hypothetical protein
MQSCAEQRLTPLKPAQPTHAGPDLRAGEPIDAKTFDRIRRRMMLEFCKWDPQIGDVATLADFPLIITGESWRQLSTLAESATAELLSAEQELLHRPDLHRTLGLPARIRRVLRRAKSPSPAAVRVMRFDFHPTTDGWRISEVNSDVPGGFTESSSFTTMMAEHCHANPAGNPAAIWAEKIARAGPRAALVYAPGYVEDMQIMAYLRDRLAERGTSAYLANPKQLRFIDGRAHLQSAEYSGPVDSVVRFFQAEWLASFRRSRNWSPLFVDGSTPIANPATAIFTESKRFSLVIDKLQTALPTWQSLLPETRSPSEVPWRTDSNWILKTAMCNTGDTVCMHGQLTPKQWRKTRLDLLLNPREWIAQRRFAATPIDSPLGPVYPCLGVYTIDGKAAGIYGRIAAKPLIDFAAIDVAVLVEERGSK